MREDKKIISWGTPPTPTRGSGASSMWAPVIDELKAKPGQYALIAQGAKAAPEKVRMAGCKVVTRVVSKDEKGKTLFDVWAMYPQVTK